MTRLAACLLIAGLLLAGAGPAAAQGLTVSSLTPPATLGDIAAMKADLPTPCGAVPAADTLNGSTGQTNCFVSRDATRPTVVQAANVTTDANGAWSVTWARAFVSPTPVVNPLPVNTGSLPILCNVSTRSGSGASGKCWQSTATTLPAAVTSVVGLLVSPFGTAAASAQVSVIAREPTQ